ncbi:MAG: DUF167 domain-containing protein [Fimbriimonadaceae bacterium]|nr:DUF167 domain-containing protein [Fimbriimonadaceae bacterium]
MFLKVIPRSSQSKVVPSSEGLKVYTNAPPVDGEANDAVIAILSKALNVPRSSITIVKGRSARLKVIQIDGLSDQEILARVTSS